jgi:hypothetical protein
MNPAHQTLIDATREFFISNENIILIHSDTEREITNEMPPLRNEYTG